MNRNPRISALVATFNRVDLLARTLPMLLAQDLPTAEFEVIVIVDGSTDETSELLNGLSGDSRLKVIRVPHQGQGCAYNAGMKTATGDYVIFLDDDIVCPSTLLSAHLLAHASGEKQIISGAILVSSESPENLATDWVRSSESHRIADCGDCEERPWPGDTKIDANTSMSRAAFMEAGGFAPEFTDARFDLEMGLRLARQGYRFQYCGAAAAQQIYVKSPFWLLTQDATTYGRNEIALCRKYPEFRHAATLASLARGPLWKQLVKRFVINTPLWTTRLIANIVQSLDRFRESRLLRRLNLRAFQSTYTCNIIRAGRQSCESAAEWRSEFAASVPVLLYHHVGPRREGTYASLTVSPKDFVRHLKWLKQAGYTCISAAQWTAWYWNAERLPEKPIVLTFDDGYKDLSEHAFPLLSQAQASATVFIVTSQIGGSNLWDQQTGSEAHQLLNEEEIKSWSKRGIDFGSHSHTHADLTTLSIPELQYELIRSQEVLSSVVGKHVSSFAYPYGYINVAVQEAVRCHYRSAFSTYPGMNSLGTDAALMMRSVVIPSDRRLDILARAVWGWNPIQAVRRRMAKVRGRI